MSDSNTINESIMEELVGWYYDECCETWGSYNSHPDIVKTFPLKK